MRPKLLSLLTFFAILVFAAAPAEARRVALIIGNSNYSALSKLVNPVPDAKAVAGVLKAHGYEVFEHYDITRADLLDALETFKQAADQSTAALIYYAGHGMELAGKNIIAPTDMEVNCDNQQALRSVEADKLFEDVFDALVCGHRVIYQAMDRLDHRIVCVRADAISGKTHFFRALFSSGHGLVVQDPRRNTHRRRTRWHILHHDCV